MLSWDGRRSQCIDLGGHRLACSNEVGDDAFVDVQVALILSEVADVVTLGKHSPYLGSETERVWKKLKDDISITGSITMPTQRCQAQCMCRVVRQIPHRLSNGESIFTAN